MFTLNWYYSKTVRQAYDMRRQVRMLLNEQRDLLSANAIANIQAAIASMTAVINANPGKKAIAEEMTKLEKIANDNLKPYPAATVRENLKEIMVAISTIMAFTTFFLQLTKIPTGSMQPTLYGITDEDLLNKPEVKIPGLLGRLKDYWVWGIQYKYFVAPEDGSFGEVKPPRTVFPFIKTQQFEFAGKPYRLWFVPDGLLGYSELGRSGSRAAVRRGPVKKGEYVFNTKVVAGDHLLVDRMTYNFRKPQRGEIVVFKTRGIQGIPQDQLYIKRLVGLPGERVQISDDRHLVINGNPLNAATKRFEMVYTFDQPDLLIEAQRDQNLRPEVAHEMMATAYRKPPYRGHVNDKVAREVYNSMHSLAPLFPDSNAVYQIPEGRMMAMGDNTLNSLDSRVWGDFDARNLIGKCWCIYWPFTERFGWGYR